MNKRKTFSYSTSRELSRYVHRWHKRIGVTASLFVIWIVISGWLLNHSDSLGLPRHQFHNSTLAHWYGLKYDIPKNVFTSNNHWLIANEEAALLDGKAFPIPSINITGLIETSSMLAVASDNSLMLFSLDGNLIDTLNNSSLPIAHIKHLGVGCDGIAIQDQAEVMASSDGIDWKICTREIGWAETKPITAAQINIAESQLVPTISFEKLIVDLHTGRFFGRFGPYVIDIIGACLLLLALSGIWMFFRQGKSRRE